MVTPPPETYLFTNYIWKTPFPLQSQGLFVKPCFSPAEKCMFSHIGKRLAVAVTSAFGQKNV